MNTIAKKENSNINGINTDRVVELAARMSQDDNYGKFCFSAQNEWINGSRSKTKIQNFYAGNSEQIERTTPLFVEADQPAFLAGENTSPNAVEHYLHSLTSCISTTIVAHAAVQGISITKLSVSAKGEMDARGFFGVSDEVPRGYSKIKINILSKTNSDQETIRSLINFSPVYEMASKSIPVHLSFSIEPG